MADFLDDTTIYDDLAADQYEVDGVVYRAAVDDDYVEDAGYNQIYPGLVRAESAYIMQDPYEHQYPSSYVDNGRMHRRLGVILVWVLAVAAGSLLGMRGMSPGAGVSASLSNSVTENVIASVAEQPSSIVTTGGGIAPLFTREIQYWAPNILRWAADHNLDPNMVATVMQIESCGDPNAVSIAGAQGLFQVMPFHFTDGEVMQDPNTNARRGMNYLAERLVQTSGDVGRAFAGYNGGHVAAGSSWDYWAHETQRYYIWSTGIYADAQTGAAQSETLNKWIQAGGGSLCAQAARRLNIGN